jgi:hypothetical protein
MSIKEVPASTRLLHPARIRGHGFVSDNRHRKTRFGNVIMILMEIGISGIRVQDLGKRK